MGSRTTYIGAVEIGTSKISVVVGVSDGREIGVIGHGECAAQGVVKGGVSDYPAASGCLQHALEEAERSAGEKIDLVFLAQTGAHLEGFYNEAPAPVKAADNVIDAADIRTVCELAKSKQLPAGRLIVDQLRRPFRVDGQLISTPPLGRVAQRIEVGYWTVHGLEQRLADHIHLIRGFNLEVRELVLSSLASGHLATKNEERTHGVLAIDIGAGTTDFVLYREGLPHLTGVVPVGGSHLTNDLSIGLRLDPGEAEMVKLRHGRALQQVRDRTEKVMLRGDYSIGDRQLSRLAIEQITAARMTELFEVVRKKLGPDFSPESCLAGAVLTGGGSQLAGATECAAKVLGVPTHLSPLLAWAPEALRDPGHMTALGVLYYGVPANLERQAGARTRNGFFTQFRRLFGRA